jgi:hypothetical protein
MTDSSPWGDRITRTLTIYANLVFVVLWVGFVVALIVNREWLDVAWAWTQALPLLPRIVVWVLFLPGLVGLWIWESSWPAAARLVGLAVIVGWTLLAARSWLKVFR